MEREIFVDTSGFYALLVSGDEQHRRAGQILKRAREKRSGFVTSDYVLDETITLLTARKHGHLIESFLDVTLHSSACRIEWTDHEKFSETVSYLLKHQDHAWSFTDCMSFVLMRKQRLRDALTRDVNFEQAGFVALLR